MGPRYGWEKTNAVANEIRMFVERERIHEKQPGGPGRSPAKKRDIIKCLRDFVPVTEG